MEAKGKKVYSREDYKQYRMLLRGLSKVKTKKYYWISYMEVIGEFKKSPLRIGSEGMKTVSTDDSLEKFGCKGRRER